MMAEGNKGRGEAEAYMEGNDLERHAHEEVWRRRKDRTGPQNGQTLLGLGAQEEAFIRQH